MKIWRLIEMGLWILAGIVTLASGHVSLIAYGCCWVILILKCVQQFVSEGLIESYEELVQLYKERIAILEECLRKAGLLQ